jgi:hypothetical protein
MMDVCVVNIFPSVGQGDINHHLLKQNASYLLDLNQRDSNYPDFVNLLNLNQIKNIDKIQKEALELYLHFIGELSQTKFKNDVPLRGLDYFGLSLYWLTDISQKQPHTHWGLNFFLFLKLIHSKSLAGFKLHLLVPKSLESLTANFEELDYSLIGHKSNGSSFFNILKLMTKNFIFVLTKGLLKKKRKLDFHHVDILALSTTTHSKRNYIDDVCKWIDLQNINLILYRLEISKESLYSFVSNYRLVNFYFQSSYSQLKLHRKIGRLPKSDFNIDGVKLNSEVLINELRGVLEKESTFLIMLNCLCYVFKRIEPKKVFYEDEYYKIGRLVSHALNVANKRHIGVGIQHGFFSKFHTVYRFSQRELQPTKQEDDQVPIPNEFITWGPYFRNCHLEGISDIRKNVYSLGNPNYIKLNNTDHNRIRPDSRTALYCLTTKNLYDKELKFVNEVLRSEKIKSLKIRSHPNFKFNVNYKDFDCEYLSFSEEKNIYDDIFKSEIVICSAHSTSFLDALICNRTVFRLITTVYSDSFTLNHPLINYCGKTEVEFKQERNNLIEEELLELGISAWDAYLKELIDD